MRPGIAASCLTLCATALAAPPPPASTIPPGRQHRLTIEGENTITFDPQVGLPPRKVDYRARVEYIVDARLGKEDRSPALAEEAPTKKAEPPKRGKAKKVAGPFAKVSGAVDLSLHSSEMSFRLDGQPVVESRISRSRFRGQVQPNAPVLDVAAKEAPPGLQAILKSYDAIAASLLLDDDDRVLDRKFRAETPQRAMIETLLSIHGPIPRGAESWEAPTQLAMGQGQTAKGRLRFAMGNKAESGDDVRVKVSGVLKAEGAVAGQFIKDGTYTVDGEQTYDAHRREWTAARWAVAVDTELANQAGVTVAHSKGTMLVESRPADPPPRKDGADAAAKP